jgi:hypothetical protein
MDYPDHDKVIWNARLKTKQGALLGEGWDIDQEKAVAVASSEMVNAHATCGGDPTRFKGMSLVMEFRSYRLRTEGE